MHCKGISLRPVSISLQDTEALLLFYGRWQSHTLSPVLIDTNTLSVCLGEHQCSRAVGRIPRSCLGIFGVTHSDGRRGMLALWPLHAHPFCSLLLVEISHSMGLEEGVSII